MQYVLGNMLNGGGINPDGLSLDLQFAADKTLTARRGPTPVFTRGSTGTFVGSDGLIQTAAINGPRFDHDPVTLACKGLLIEESRTNLVSRSQEFSNWSFQNSTLGSSAIAPDGNNTANSVAFQNSTSTPTAFYSYMARLVSVSVTAGQQYTVSFYVKASTNTSINIGTNGQTSGLNNSGALVNVTTSWTRVSFTLTAAANDSGLFAIIGSGFNGVSTYLSARTIEIWGAQVEAGSFPTSYIPTTTGTLARSADVCSITGSDFDGLYNQSEGTLLLSADEFRRGVSYPTFLAINDSAIPNANRINIGGYPKTGDAVPVEFIVASGGTNQYSAIQTSTPSNFKAALAYKLDDARAALNGALAAADAPPSVMPIGANNLRIGGVGMYISSVRYYRKRLPNAKLVTLTT
jgi:hypothetical protein